MRIALTDVLPGGRAGATVVHLTDPFDDELTLCSQHEDGRVAHRGTMLDVDCMTCLVRANRPSLKELVATALNVPKEFLYGDDEDGADDR
jgi:hypothetical protein